MHLKRLLLPFFILFSLISLLTYELFYAKPNELPSPLIGETVPKFTLANIYPDKPEVTNQLLKGRVMLLNFWASWCDACTREHAMLMKINREYHIPIYGIAYKDNLKNATDWLNQEGNPYTMAGNDLNGDVAIDFGVYGTPETYVLNKEGKIVYKHIGMIDQNNWDNVIYPVIKKYGG